MNPLTKMLKGTRPVTEESISRKEEGLPLEKEKETAIQIHGLKKSYGSFEVLRGVDISVLEGEAFGLIGRNGIGKSTTIDCMVGLKSFQEGTIEIFGNDVLASPEEAKRCFGYVASEPTAYEVMTGKEYLSFVAGAYGVKQNQFVTNYHLLATRLRFNDQDLKKRIREYSHGMKQKICLIASLIHNPRIWILDEPTVGLDAFTANELCKMMREFVSHGKTVFVASHNIDLIARLCDRVAVINKGLIQKVFDLKENPRERYDLNRYFLENAKEKEEENGQDAL